MPVKNHATLNQARRLGLCWGEAHGLGQALFDLLLQVQQLRQLAGSATLPLGADHTGQVDAVDLAAAAQAAQVFGHRVVELLAEYQ